MRFKKKNVGSVTISTTLKIAEYEEIKNSGYKWNQLLRVGYSSLKGGIQQQNNERIATLEKSYNDVRERYFSRSKEVNILRLEIEKLNEVLNKRGAKNVREKK